MKGGRNFDTTAVKTDMDLIAAAETLEARAAMLLKLAADIRSAVA